MTTKRRAKSAAPVFSVGDEVLDLTKKGRVVAVGHNAVYVRWPSDEPGVIREHNITDLVKVPASE